MKACTTSGEAVRGCAGKMPATVPRPTLGRHPRVSMLAFVLAAAGCDDPAASDGFLIDAGRIDAPAVGSDSGFFQDAAMFSDSSPVDAGFASDAVVPSDAGFPSDAPSQRDTATPPVDGGLPGSGCTWNGAVLAEGEEVMAFAEPVVARVEECRSELRRCEAAALTGSFQFEACEVDVLRPVVAIESPSNGAALGGGVLVRAQVMDNLGVAMVEFLLDGTLAVGSATAAPYEVSWSTATVADGEHTLTAVATDLAGHQATSSPVRVTINNTMPLPPTCALQIGEFAYAAGSQMDLSWRTTNAPATARLMRGTSVIEPNVDLSAGQMNLTAPEILANTLTYRLEVSNSAGQGSCRAQVFVGTPIREQPPEQSFIWIGNPDGTFSNSELRYMAENYAVYVDNKVHGERNYENRLAEVAKLKILNPNIKAFFYMGMAIRFRYDLYGEPFDDSFYLKNELPDHRGENIGALGPTGNVAGHYVDLSNASYRQWVFMVLRDIFARAPYDGVAFDNSNTREVHQSGGLAGLIDHPDWRDGERNKISLATLDAWNAGIPRVINGARTRGGAAEVIFNGIGGNTTTRNQDLDLLHHADYGANETFCIVRHRGVAGFLTAEQYQEDIDVMHSEAAQGHRLLQKTKYRHLAEVTTNQEFQDHFGIGKTRAMRFCYGLFMMGHRPGYTFYKFGPDYTNRYGEVRENPVEMQIELRAPTRDYTVLASGLFRRAFQDGLVVVNATDASRTVTLGRDYIRMEGANRGPRLPSGTRVNIAPRDAVFFMKP